MITLDEPIAHSKAGQSLKVERVPETIEVSTVADTGISGLHILQRRPKAGKKINPICYQVDAKRIYAWMIWHLPAGTMEKLRDLIVSKDVA